MGVKITVKELPPSEGNRLYTIEANEVEIVKPTGSPEGDNPRDAGAERNGPQVGFNKKVAAMIAKVKAAQAARRCGVTEKKSRGLAIISDGFPRWYFRRRINSSFVELRVCGGAGSTSPLRRWTRRICSQSKGSGR